MVWIPKYRRKALYAELRRYLGPVFRDLAQQRECTVEEGHLQVDHVHMLIAILPKYAVAQVIGYVKGKRAIHIARTYLGRRQNFTGQSFWARGYYVSTVGRNEATIREVHPETRGGGPAPRSTRDLRAATPPSGVWNQGTNQGTGRISESGDPAVSSVSR